MLSFQKTFACLFLIVLSAPVWGQQAYVPGYVVTLENDTVRGWIKDRGVGKRCLKVEFRENEAGAVTTYRAPELSAFATDAGQHYRSMVLPNWHRTQAQLEYPKVEMQRDTLFAIMLVDGEPGLFATQDRQGYKHLYFADEGKLWEIVERVPADAGDLGKEVATLALLESRFSDCRGLVGKLAAASLNRRKQQAVLKEYYECTNLAGPNSVFALPKVVARKRILLGMNTWKVKIGSTSPTFNATAAAPRYNLTLGFKPSGSVGLGIQWELPGNGGKHSILSDLIVDYKWSDAGPVERTSYDYTYTLKTLYLSLPIQYRYTFPGRKVRPYVQAGAAFGWALLFSFPETRVPTVDAPGFTESEQEVYEGDERRALEQSLLGGLGLQMGKFSLEGRYAIGNGFIPSVAVNATTHTISLLGGVRF
jgi:hypothetical protein